MSSQTGPSFEERNADSFVDGEGEEMAQLRQPSDVVVDRKITPGSINDLLDDGLDRSTVG